MKTIITEYKPHGVWRALACVALALLPIHVWVAYQYKMWGYEYTFWLLRPKVAVISGVAEAVIVYYLLTTVNIVVNTVRNKVYRSMVVCGVPFNQNETDLGKPEYISLVLQHGWKEGPRGSIDQTQSFDLSAWEGNTHVLLFSYGAEVDARKVGQGIADALGIPFYDRTQEE